MAPDADLSLAEWVVLAVVDTEPAHGFAVGTLTARTGVLGRIWTIPRPVVYRCLTGLAEAGLIRPIAVERARGPQRTVYATTPESHGRVVAWLREPVPHVREVRSGLLLKLALLHRRGADAGADRGSGRGALLTAQRGILTALGSHVHERPSGPSDGFEPVLALWRAANVAAAIGFVDALLAEAGPSV